MTEDEKIQIIDEIGSITSNSIIINMCEFKEIIPVKYKHRPLGKVACKLKKKNIK